MGYQIIYGDSGFIRRTFPSASGRLTGYIAVFFLLFLILTKTFWPAGTEKLRQIILPCDPDVTATAFSGLVADLGHGENLTDAVTAFCREIALNGERSD